MSAALACLLAAVASGAAEPPPQADRSAGAAPGDDSSMGARLQGTLRKHGADVYGCYDRALTETQEALAGEVLVRLWVAPGGRVPRVEVLKDEVGSGPLATCLTKAMRGWSVPELAGPDTVQVVFPLVFRPDERGAGPGGAGRLEADRARDLAARALEARARGGHGSQAAPPRFVVPLADGKPGPLGASGRVQARVLIDPVTVGPTSATLTHLTLAPSARLAPHSHPGVLELLYVVRGMARVRGGKKGELITASAGDVIVVPPSGLHSIESAPLAPLVLLQIFAPGGPEHAYRDAGDRAGTVPGRPTEKATDMPAVVRAAEPPALPLPGGKGRVQLFVDNPLLGQASLQRIEAEAGAAIQLHAHDRSDEVLFVLSGRATIDVGDAGDAGHGGNGGNGGHGGNGGNGGNAGQAGGNGLPVAAGDAIHLPMGTPHAVKVTERLVAIQCYAPGGPERQLKQASEPR